ncbi:MAG: leucine-rich repeat protein, partial [Parasporobacterium sp.]|nr:leucine-rich repeat protein [Parasporobacterium sp.]
MYEEAESYEEPAPVFDEEYYEPELPQEEEPVYTEEPAVEEEPSIEEDINYEDDNGSELPQEEESVYTEEPAVEETSSVEEEPEIQEPSEEPETNEETAPSVPETTSEEQEEEISGAVEETDQDITNPDHSQDTLEEEEEIEQNNTVVEEETEQEDPEEILISEYFEPGLQYVDLSYLYNEDDDLLLQNYLDQQIFGIVPLLMAAKGVSFQLGEHEQIAYGILRSAVAEIAAGNRSITTVEIPLSEFGIDTSQPIPESDLGLSAPTYTYENGEFVKNEAAAQEAQEALEALWHLDWETVVNVLLAECPYELYWSSKSAQFAPAGYRNSSTYNGTEVLTDYYLDDSIAIAFFVAADYQGSDFITDTSITGAASQAAAVAGQIVNSAVGLSDYEKLVYYKDTICNSVSYNYEAAAAGGYVNYNQINPWQIIWVFDNDAGTNVVCEGYAKAFKYLCDLTAFDSPLISCITVTGSMTGGTGAGGHMWNIVTMENGKNYLVDVTNCDEGSIGWPDELFLAGTTDTVSENDSMSGYIFHANNTDITYCYDADTFSLYNTTSLTLSKSSYDPEAAGNDIPDLQYLIDSIPAVSDGTGTQYYYYYQLTDPEKAIYWQIYNATLEDYEFQISGFDDYSEEEVQNLAQRAMTACVSDHPMIHAYFERYIHSTKEENDSYSFSLGLNRVSSPYLISKAMSKANDIVARVGTEEDRYTRVRRLLTILAYETEYDPAVAGSFSYSENVVILNDCLLSCLANGLSVCAGFTDALKYLCDMLFIPCIVVGNAGHAWNFIQMEDGKWYSVDLAAIAHADNFSTVDLQLSMIAELLLLGSYSNYYAGNSNYHLSDLYLGSVGYFEFPVLAETQYVYEGTYTETYQGLELSFAEPELLFLYSVNQDGTTCTITGCEGDTSGDLVIPEMIDGYMVTCIGNCAFYGCTGFTGSLVIPDTVTRIEASAFLNCNQLSGELTLPGNLEYLGSCAFTFCENLQGSVYLPDSIIDLGLNVFYGCVGLDGNLRIPNQVDITSSFLVETGFSSISIDESNEKYVVFDGVLYSRDMTILICCPPGKTGSLIIPDGVLEISDNACNQCKGLEGTLSLPDSLITVGVRAFNGCSGFSGDLILPDSIEEIKYGAFGIDGGDVGYGGILHLPASVKSIEDFAFASCRFTGDLVIPDSLESIEGDFIFHGNTFSYIFCSCNNECFLEYYDSVQPYTLNGLIRFHSAAGTVQWNWADDYSSAKALFTCADCLEEQSIEAEILFETIEMPSEDEGTAVYTAVVNGSHGAKYQDSKTISLISGLKQLATGQPMAAVIMTSGEPDRFCFTAEESGLYRFSSFGNFGTAAELYNAEMELILSGEEDGTSHNFSIVTQLVAGETYYYYVHFSDSEKTGSFPVVLELYNQCGDEVTWYFSEDTRQLTISGNGNMWNYSSADSYPWYLYWPDVKTIIIEEGVTNIPDYAFSNYLVEQIILPDSLVNIGAYAISFDTYLTFIDLSNGIKSIGQFAFTFTGLETLRFGTNVESIGTEAFWHCSSLDNVYLPDSLLEIDRSAFGSCSSLKSIIIPENVQSVGEAAFVSCRSLEHVVFRNEMDSLERSCFENCPALRSIVLPINLSEIETGVFNWCENLSDVYYCGPESEWNGVTVSGLNAPLSSATIHYNYDQGHEHEYKTEVITQSDCVTTGITKHTCLICLQSYTEEIPMLEHTAATDAAVAATCTTVGLTEGSHCSVCGTVLAAQEEIPALGHDYSSEVTKEATCTETGVRTYTCSRCDDSYTEEIPMLEHTVVTDAAVTATCTTTGLTEGSHCSVCGTILAAQEEIPMLEHTVVIDAAVTATCTATGLTEGSHCSICGTVLIAQEEIPALGHDYSSEVTKEATCTETGVRTYTCSRCDDSYMEEIPMLEHTAVTDTAVAATCTAIGLTEGSHCSVCGTVLVAQEEIPAFSHDYFLEITKEATCTETGVRTYTCSRCDDSYTEEIPMLEHTAV